MVCGSQSPAVQLILYIPGFLNERSKANAFFQPHNYVIHRNSTVLLKSQLHYCYIKSESSMGNNIIGMVDKTQQDARDYIYYR